MPKATGLVTSAAIDENRANRPDSTHAVANFIRFLETGIASDGLFAPNTFLDLSLPQWRIQSDTYDDLIAVRVQGHPFPGEVRVGRVQQTDAGFTMEFEERWDNEGQRWYCREMVRADVVGDTIVELAVYCTGDWDAARQREHAQSVRLIRP